MSTFLELVNTSRQLCGVSGADLTTVVNQTGEARRFVNWVAQVWREIQLTQVQWKFHHLDFSFLTVAGQRAYTPTDAAPTGLALASFKTWDLDSLRICADTVNYSDEMVLPFVPYKAFRDTWEFGAMRVQRNRPVAFTEGEQRELRLGTLPDGVYQVNGKYWRGVQTLVANTDVPLCPADYHDLILYGTKIKYGLYESAPEVIEDGQMNYSPMYHQLVIDQCPMLQFGSPLA